MSVLDTLPEHGWGVLRCPLPIILLLHGAGHIKVQVTPHRDVWQVRLTGSGRRYRDIA